MSADDAYRLSRRGTGILWRGDYQNGRHLLDAMARRADRKPAPRRGKNAKAVAPLLAFNAHRKSQGERARVLGMLLLPFEPGHVLPLRRAPNVAEACGEAYGFCAEPYVASMRELLGIIGAHEWRRKGVELPVLGGRIHPYYGVFAPIRNEYIDLVARAPFVHNVPASAFDVGTGTGVLAAVLAQRGVSRIVATDNDPRAIDCARDNIGRLGLLDRVELVHGEFFPPGRAPLIVCNPPWIPAQPAASIERAIFDPDSRMLKGFLERLAVHLEPEGEGWLILSDFAERLGLRTRDALLEWIQGAGLRVVDRLDTHPRHPKAGDPADPLHAVRSAEITSLWRLAARDSQVNLT
ncbi:MAG: class I SAM-dependent methyltransferase [Betaproteobacteria bacterium]